MTRLEEFIRALGGEMHLAQVASSRLWPGTYVAGMEVVVAATVERVASGALALRIGRAPRGKATAHELCIEVPGDAAEAITVRLDGNLLGRYGGRDDDEAH
ncbi:MULTISPECIES: hypothetical protein [unclassified Pseudomonas]|jgi:hypothetical protein|uniref:hypothetical protein n=1 Tax=unclassified Pseudomonas TaxID=196821 RepID=UPI0002883E79|nr:MULTISPECIES: hypothetical protein [unclassified Pseudomonas]QJI37596.1 hypothetical protein HKK54_25380 [Pseudomonas sp. ADAK13]